MNYLAVLIQLNLWIYQTPKPPETVDTYQSESQENLPLAPERLNEEMEALQEKNIYVAPLLKPQTSKDSDPWDVRSETDPIYKKSVSAYYESFTRSYEHRTKVFEWQLLSSKILFVMVLILVFSGLYFAAIQFQAGLGKGRQKKENASKEASELVLSIKELKVRSPVLGVIVLTISLAFFYLYLVHVFPIEVLPASTWQD